MRAPDLDCYVSLGLPITTRANPDTEGYFERLSWENAGLYSPDIIMWDTRRASNKPAEMKQHPVFAALPAAGDRFAEWDAVAPMSCAGYAKIMNKLADQLEVALTRVR
ncbi:ABC transporter substrate-binding protein [Lentzea tibetensis]|uniref:ABC transporter substrate-binding protein n=1 Tax=Lentzea tibetensis TaxID=2591470 RepID=UPI0022A6E112|nr:ABC transporter substrate-binding protein [Lentzea tibetensis]